MVLGLLGMSHQCSVDTAIITVTLATHICCKDLIPNLYATARSSASWRTGLTRRGARGCGGKTARSRSLSRRRSSDRPPRRRPPRRGSVTAGCWAASPRAEREATYLCAPQICKRQHIVITEPPWLATGSGGSAHCPPRRKLASTGFGRARGTLSRPCVCCSSFTCWRRWPPPAGSGQEPDGGQISPPGQRSGGRVLGSHVRSVAEPPSLSQLRASNAPESVTLTSMTRCQEFLRTCQRRVFVSGRGR